MMKKLFILLLFFSSATFSNVDLYPFKEKNQSQRFVHLTENFRCLVCQNQSIADSNAPLAIDLKNVVYEQILSGKSDQEIKQFLVSKYGNFVVFEPPLAGHTFVLWLFPLILFLLGILVSYGVIRRARSMS